MGKIRDEILLVSQKANAAVKEIEKEDRENIRLGMINRFAQDDNYQNYIWSNLPPRSFASCQDPNAWLLISSFLKNEEKVLILFNRSDEEAVLEFSYGNEVIPVLQECDDFEYYMTNESYEYFVCFNHHDALMAAGSALPWLESLTDSQSQLIKPVSELMSL
jgi:hypothetical protein